MKDEELDQYFRNDRRDFLDYDNKVPENSIRTVEKAKNQPEQLKDNRTMWKKLKRTMIKKLLPTIRELADIDLMADYDNGVISASVRVYFAGELMFSRSKKFKV